MPVTIEVTDDSITWDILNAGPWNPVENCAIKWLEPHFPGAQPFSFNDTPIKAIMEKGDDTFLGFTECVWLIQIREVF